MKTISAKEFQMRQSETLHAVSAGEVHVITFHGKPWVELRPMDGLRQTPKRGSAEAVRRSLEHTFESTNLPAKPDYKKLRRISLMPTFGSGNR